MSNRFPIGSRTHSCVDRPCQQAADMCNQSVQSIHPCPAIEWCLDVVLSPRLDQCQVAYKPQAKTQSRSDLEAITTACNDQSFANNQTPCLLRFQRFPPRHKRSGRQLIVKALLTSRIFHALYQPSAPPLRNIRQLPRARRCRPLGGQSRRPQRKGRMRLE